MIRRRKKNALFERGKEIMEAIDRIQNQLEVARERFENATDDALIDSYIHEIIALHKKYDYFLKEAKMLGLTAIGASNNRKIG